MKRTYQSAGWILFTVFIFLGVAFFLPSITNAKVLQTMQEEGLVNPLAGFKAKLVAPEEIYGGRILRTLLGLSGVVALVLFVSAGITWLLSAGNPERVKKAKGIIVWTVVGLVVIFGSYIILRALFGVLPRPAPVPGPAQLPPVPGPERLPPVPGPAPRPPVREPAQSPLVPEPAPLQLVPRLAPRPPVPGPSRQ